MKYVVITAVGNDRTGIVNELSNEILNDGGNIEDSRMAVLGGAVSRSRLRAGEQTAIDKLVTQIPKMEKKLGLTMVIKETEPKPHDSPLIPYRIDIVSMDHPGIVHDVADFFASKKINIEDMSTATYSAAHTGTPIFSMHMMVAVDADASIAELRYEFQEFCDRLNLDVSMEPAPAAAP